MKNNIDMENDVLDRLQVLEKKVSNMKRYRDFTKREIQNWVYLQVDAREEEWINYMEEEIKQLRNEHDNAIIKVFKEAEILKHNEYEYIIDRYDAEMEAQMRYKNDQHLV